MGFSNYTNRSSPALFNYSSKWRFPGYSFSILITRLHSILQQWLLPGRLLHISLSQKGDFNPFLYPINSGSDCWLWPRAIGVSGAESEFTLNSFYAFHLGTKNHCTCNIELNKKKKVPFIWGKFRKNTTWEGTISKNITYRCKE